MNVNWPRLFWRAMHYWSLLRLAKLFIVAIATLNLIVIGVLVYDIIKDFT